MDMRPYTFDLHEGWPPDGESGDYIGFDRAWRPILLRWSAFRDAVGWYGVQWQDNGYPQVLRRADDTESRVVQWARLPVRSAALDAAETALETTA